jgi:hypothetical protein
MQTIKTMWKAIFQNKLTIYKANLPSFVKKIIKSRCYVDLSRRLRMKSHPKMAAWERLIKAASTLTGTVFVAFSYCYPFMYKGIENNGVITWNNTKMLRKWISVEIVSKHVSIVGCISPGSNRCQVWCNVSWDIHNEKI